MKFKKIEELEFQDYRFKNFLQSIRKGVLFGLFLYILFGFCDNLNFPDSKQLVFLIRYVFIFPFFILIYISTYLKFFRKIVNFVLALAVIIPSFGIISMMMISHSSEIGYYLYYAAIMINILLACTFFKLKLLNFIISSLIILYTYEFVAIYFQNFLEGGIRGKYFPFLLTNILFMFSIMIIGSVITYMFDLNLRKEFIQKKAMKEEGEKLTGSEEKYRTLVENMEEGIGEVDENEAFVYVNNATADIFGYSKEEMIGKNLKEFTKPEMFQKILKETSLRKKGISAQYELAILTKNGEQKIVTVIPTPIITENGEYKGCFGIVHNITEHRHAERALHFSQETFHNIVDNNPSGIVIIDDEGIVRFVNPSAEEFFNRKAEDLIDTLFGFPLVAGGSTEIDIIRKGGTIGAGEMSTAESEWNSKPAQIIMINDITERKQAEEDLRQSKDYINNIMSSMIESLIVTNWDGNINKVNKATCELFGYDEEDLIGKPISTLVAEDEEEGFNALMMNEIIEKGFIRDKEMTFISRNNRTINLLFSGSNIRNEIDETLGIVWLAEDITDRKQAGDELKASNQQLLDQTQELSRMATVVKDSNDAILIHDLEGNITAWNAGATKTYGYSEQEAFKMNVSDLVPEEYKAEALNFIIQLKKGELVESLETKRETKDGKILDVWMVVTKLVDENGKLIGAATTERDITERKQAEERISHLNIILRSVRDVNQLITKENNRDVMLQESCKILTRDKGYSNVWLVLLDEDHKVDFATTSGVEGNFQLLINDLKKGNLPYCVKKALKQQEVLLVDNTEFACADCPISGQYEGNSALAVRLECNKKVYGLLCARTEKEYLADDEMLNLFREITGDIAFALYRLELEAAHKQAEKDLQESEEKYHQLFTNIGEGVATVDLKDNFVYCNPAAEMIFGVPAGKLVGKNLNNFLSPQMSEIIKSQTDKRKVGEKSTYELEIITPTGKERQLLITVTPQFDKERNVIGAFGNFRDITEHKQAEDQIRRDLKEKELLLAEVHHRVKNNLQVISGLLQLQQNEIQTKEDALKGFAASQDRILAMAKAYELLLGSEYMSEVSVGKYIEALAEQLKNNYDIHHKVKISYSLDDLTISIEILDRLGLILNELITNAIKYAFEGRDKGNIYIELKEAEKHVVIKISDDGVGIPKEVKIHDPATLGLSIVDMITQQLQGTLKLERKNGTSCTLVIPKEI